MTSWHKFQTTTLQQLAVVAVLAVASVAASAQTVRAIDGTESDARGNQVNPFSATNPLRTTKSTAGGTKIPGLCNTDEDCDDGIFCNGPERCNITTAGSGCVEGVPPCAGLEGCDSSPACDEEANACAADCNENRLVDACDILSGSSTDIDGDSIPDDCQADCKGNGVPDSYEIETGTSEDCNDNGVPDKCDTNDETSKDCNENRIPDECEDSGDCNGNGVLDSCDILDGVENDCNANGIPDSCDVRGKAAVYFVFETGNDTLYRIQDLNGDGDANDEGEGGPYGDIDGVEGIDVDQRNGDVYTAEEGNELIYRYRDLNGDGDAFDEGEKFLYADDADVGEDDIENIAVDESTNTVYTVYEDENLIVWHRDNNGDGDALDDGEWGDFTRIGDDLEAIAVDASTGEVFVGDAECDDVWWLDPNGDELGTAGDEIGHEAIDFNDNTGELFAGDEDFNFVTRWVNGVENRYADLSCCSEALAVDPVSGDLFVGDEDGEFAVAGKYACGQIFKYTDLNGDGDALDEGERTLFHDFIFRDQGECETEALAAFGGGGTSNDDNGDGIPDECALGGGENDNLKGNGSTGESGSLESTAFDPSNRVLAGISVSQAETRKQVSWRVSRVEGMLGRPGPGAGTSDGFDNGIAFVRTFDTKITSNPQTYTAVVFINLNDAELTGANLNPEDVRLHALVAGQWEVAGTNDLGNSAPTTNIGDYGFTFRGGERSFWAVRDDATISFAVGVPVVAAQPQPEQPVPGDDDADGVTNDIDLCPNTPAGTTVDADGCAIVDDEPTQTTPDTNTPPNMCGVGLCGTTGVAMMLAMMFGLVGLRTRTRRVHRRTTK